MPGVRIVEATIRDGGYMVDHHYSRIDLATLVGGLDRAGLPYIEVGHGNGVGSQFFRDPKLRATALPLVDDDGHAAVALAVASRAKIGVVLTAGKRFAPAEYIDHIADLGYAFIRLAAMPDEIDDELFAYVRRVKQRGMIVSVNMMQTYAKTPAQVAELANRAAGHGCDWFYVVDSGGGMMADDVKRYVAAILGATRIEVGLHSHNNLGLAVANSLAAVDAGATLVDGTLNGIGRATGNPATEQLAIALRDRMAEPLDLDALVVLGNAVRSLFQDPGNDPIDFVSGGALLHSRNVPKVLEAARKRERSPSAFLLAVGAKARERGTLNAMAYDEELYDACAAETPPARAVSASDAMVANVKQAILDSWNADPARTVEELALRSRQRHVRSVVHVSRSAPSTRPVPWQRGALAGITLRGSDGVWEVPAHRRPDYVLVDEGDPEPPLVAHLATFRIPFADVYARAVADLQLALNNAGVTSHVLGDPGDDAQIPAGEVAVGHAAPARITALRARGVRVLQPPWTSAVAQLAETLIALHRELGAEGQGELVSGLQVAGEGQAAWDPDRAMLVASDDPERDAQRAATVYLRSILGGRRL